MSDAGHARKQMAESLKAIEDGSMQLEPLLPFIDNLFSLLNERSRRFVSSWGAIGQQGGLWGTDLGNVVYATAWNHLCQSTGRWFGVKSVTSLNGSGNIIEMLLGFMYLIDWLPAQALIGDFFAQCRAHKFTCFVDVWSSTYAFLKDNRDKLLVLSGWRASLEMYILAWRNLLFYDCPATFSAWITKRSWDCKRILNAAECLRMGWPSHALNLHEAFYEHPRPPPAAILPQHVIAGYWREMNRTAPPQ